MTEQAKETNALMNYYLKAYKKRWGTAPQFNRFKYKWGFQDMLMDIGYESSIEVIDHYLSLKVVNHPAQTLLYNYDRYALVIKERKEDKVNRQLLRAKTAEAVKKREEDGDS